jgi:hypothetical protein
MRLLKTCNDTVESFSQPILYQGSGKEAADEAFHISIGWALNLQVDEASNKALRVFDDAEFQSLQSWKIQVPGVKVKIGNVVSHLPLSTGSTPAASKGASTSLFAL